MSSAMRSREAPRAGLARRVVVFYASALVLGFGAAFAHREIDESWLAYGVVGGVATVLGVTLAVGILDRRATEDERIGAVLQRQRVLRMTVTIVTIVVATGVGGGIAVLLLLTQSHSTQQMVAVGTFLATLLFRLGGLGLAEAALRTHEIDRLLLRRKKGNLAGQAAGSASSDERI
jgi:uncharacterized membrane protein YfcA